MKYYIGYLATSKLGSFEPKEIVDRIKQFN
jgi:hypothetical protein